MDPNTLEYLTNAFFTVADVRIQQTLDLVPRGPGVTMLTIMDQVFSNVKQSLGVAFEVSIPLQKRADFCFMRFPIV